MNVDAYLARDYGAAGCWSLVADVMQDHFGESVTGFKDDGDSRAKLPTTYRMTLHNAKSLRKLAEPADMCIVMMGSSLADLDHCGVYWKGSVMHALSLGNRFDSLLAIRITFPGVEFWGHDA